MKNLVTIISMISILMFNGINAFGANSGTATSEAKTKDTKENKEANVAKNNTEVITLTVTETGFEPNSVDVTPGKSVILKITRKTDATCATQIKIPAKKILKELPLNQTVEVKVGRLEKGEIRFSCGMDMITGVINVR